MTSLDPARRRLVATLLLGCLAWATLGLATAAPASAHPFGEPQTMQVTVDGAEVRLRWKVGGTDDLTALALHLELLPPERVMLDGAVLYEDGDGDLLAAAPAFADYLLDRVQVVAAGRGCAGDLLPVTDLVADGAVLAFDCTGSDVSGGAVVTARMLTDLHPEYRTLASGPGGQRAVYDAEHPEHTWSLTGEPVAVRDDLSRSAAVQLGSVLGVLLAGGVGAAFWVRRRGRREGVPVA